MELPRNTPRVMWLFPDNIIENYDYKFLDFKEHKTTTNKEIPCFVVYGKIKGREQGTELEGELITSIWNIENYDDIISKYSTTESLEKVYFKIQKGSNPNKLKFIVVESV